MREKNETEKSEGAEMRQGDKQCGKKTSTKYQNQRIILKLYNEVLHKAQTTQSTNNETNR